MTWDGKEERRKSNRPWPISMERRRDKMPQEAQDQQPGPKTLEQELGEQLLQDDAVKQLEREKGQTQPPIKPM